MTKSRSGKSRRIVLVLPSLTAGGSQRVIALMANRWAEMSRQVCLITLSASDDDFFPLHRGVNRNGLNLTADSRGPAAAIWGNIRRIRRLRAAIRTQKPDVIVSFIDQTNVLTLLAAAGTKIPVIVAERTDPRHHPLNRMWSLLRRWTYRRAAALVAQTRSVGSFLEGAFPGCGVHVIPNPVSPPSEEVYRPRDAGLAICAIGRLSKEKGFDRLIEAFGMAASDYPRSRLIIYGDGPERASLELLAAQQLPGRVTLPGWTTNLAQTFSETGIFCLPSRYEGFPNVLLEAMAHGMAVISFDCESGPAEIVEHDVNGILVAPGDTRGFAAAIQRLLSDADTRRQLGECAKAVSERFGVDQFFDEWDTLFDEVV